METDPTCVAEILVGLGADVTIIGVDDGVGEPLRVHVRLVRERPLCLGCGGATKIGDTARVELVDLAAFGRATRLVWHKRQWRCRVGCGHGAVTEQASEIAAPRHLLTTRAGRWATVQVGRYGRPVQHVADELGADWHTINDAVAVWGQALLDADQERVGSVSAIGLDETLSAKTGRYRHKQWATSIVDVGSGQLLDMVKNRDAVSVTKWFDRQPKQWRDQIRYAALDMSSGYKLVYDTILPAAIQVIDPFHLVKLATAKIDDCRRRVQNEQLGHRGRKPDPLYRSRKLLTMGAERLDAERHHRLRDLLNDGDPDGEIRRIWWAKEKLRQLYKRPDRGVAAAMMCLYAEAFRQPRNPPELRQLGRTITKWLTPITAWWLHAQISNGPTESANNLIKRTKRIGFGFTNFNNYRIRCLLYAGKPNWQLLNTLNPPEIR